MRLLNGGRQGPCVKNATLFANIFALLFSAGFLLVLLGCQNPLQQPPNVADEADTGPGTLLLTINRLDVGRTIMPGTTLDDFVRFDLEFVAVCDAGNDDHGVTWTDGNGTIELYAGTWELHVTAFLDAAGERPVAWGFLDDIVIASREAQVGNVVLRPSEEGEGTFAWYVSFTGSIAGTGSLTRIEIVRLWFCYDHMDWLDSETDIIVIDSPANASSRELASGLYRVLFTLWSGEEGTVISALLYIYKNMYSRFDGERATFSFYHFPVSLLTVILDILREWDWSTWWTFEAAEISPQHFAFVVDGVVDNTLAITQGFNDILGARNQTPPTNLAGLKALVDAALVHAGGDWPDYALQNRTTVEKHIAGFVVNGTPITGFSWGLSGVTVNVGGFSTGINFLRDIELWPLTGTVTIVGPPEVGEMLTAVTAIDTLANDGMNVFQWRRDGVLIDGVTGPTYTVLSSDLGQVISVRVTRANRSGYLSDITNPITGPLTAAGATLVERFNWVRTQAGAAERIVVEMDGNASLNSAQASLVGASNLTVILRGTGSVPRELSLAGTGSLFTISNNVTFVLDNVILRGVDGNSGPLVRVDAGGTLEMLAGSSVTGNVNDSDSTANRGGGVRVSNGGTFTMFGGEISGNVAAGDWNEGSGVFVAFGGTFNMRGGAIFGNGLTWAGGGVFNDGTFNISDGIIHGVDAEDGLANVAHNGAALFNTDRGIAQRGLFENGELGIVMGFLYTADNTINVRNGMNRGDGEHLY